MKKIVLNILLLTALPVLAIAAGGHDDHDHGKPPAPEAEMNHGMPGDAHASMAGKPGDAAKVNRVVEISMDDSMRFTPSAIHVMAGETIRFFIKNNGKLTHEMVIGSLDELQEHAAMMRAMPDMKHAEPNMITLAPGQRGGLVWQFNQAGIVDFACLIPGHMEAGMVGKIVVK
ncbi:MAG TPA: cupredoxin family protein [Gammaproteobacteria bacterium]|nr:cupredoxin family protein [Gammaproteobacteria bacterium]